MNGTGIPDAAAGGAQAAQMIQGLLALVRRLHAVLEAESEDLRSNRLAHLEEHARQKDKLMLDLSRLPRCAPLQGAEAEAVRHELARLEAALARNSALLKLHMEATGEFAEFLEDTIRRRQTDGTYTRRRAAAGYGKW